MTKLVPTLSWKPYGSDGLQRVAFVQCVSSTDPLWNIQNVGTIAGSDTGENIVAKFVLIDNLPNNGNVVLQMGGVNFTVPAFERESFPIPPGITNYQILVPTGSINVYFSEARLAGDQSNNLLVQQTAVVTLIYSYVNYNANQAQLISDLNKSALFKPTVANIVYSLLPITTPVGNGWTEFVYNFGTKSVSLTPNGGDSLTFDGAAYNNAAPLILQPGASGILSSDGVQWYYSGTVGKSGPIRTVAATGSQNAQDDNIKIVFNSAAAINWSLLGIAANTNVFWSQPLQNFGAGAVSIFANGADTINGVFTAAIPLILRQGDSGILSCDGINWYFQGTTHFETAEVNPLTTGAVFNVAHGLGKIPNDYKLIMRCKVVDAAYAVGDELEMSGTSVLTSGGAVVQGNPFANSTNIGFMRAAGVNLTPQVVRKDTQAVFTISVAANYAYVMKAYAYW